MNWYIDCTTSLLPHHIHKSKTATFASWSSGFQVLSTQNLAIRTHQSKHYSQNPHPTLNDLRSHETWQQTKIALGSTSSSPLSTLTQVPQIFPPNTNYCFQMTCHNQALLTKHQIQIWLDHERVKISSAKQQATFSTPHGLDPQKTDGVYYKTLDHSSALYTLLLARKEERKQEGKTYTCDSPTKIAQVPNRKQIFAMEVKSVIKWRGRFRGWYWTGMQRKILKWRGRFEVKREREIEGDRVELQKT